MSWESSYDSWKTTPPEEPDEVLTDEFSISIYPDEIYYQIGGWILSERSAEDCKCYLEEEGESFVCACCEDEFNEDDYSEPYYLVNGEKYCSDCFESTEETARAYDPRDF